MQVTLKQVAEQAGVSVQTASRILGGHDDRHRPATRRRVLAAAKKLAYRPNRLSHALMGRKSMTLGLIIKGFGSRLANERVRRLVSDATEAGYFVYIVNLDRQGDDSDRLIDVARDLVDRRVDGLILYRSLPASVVARRFLAQLPVPVVYVGWGPPREKRRITYDREHGIRALAIHLRELGHREAVMFPTADSHDFLEHKVLPYRRAFAAAELDLHIPASCILPRDVDLEEAAHDRVLAHLNGTRGDSTVLLMSSDDAAVGALAAARAAGRSVPDDLSIVGFNDTPGSRYCDPPLTTIHAPGSAVGQCALQMLQPLLADPNAVTDPVVFRYELVVRNSTGPAPQQAVRTACRHR